jgi:hypothetical protein
VLAQGWKPWRMKRLIEPMSASQIDVGIPPVATIALTPGQLRQLAAVIKSHSGGVRIEVLPDAYVRVVLTGDENEPVMEKLLWAV